MHISPFLAADGRATQPGSNNRANLSKNHTKSKAASNPTRAHVRAVSLRLTKGGRRSERADYRLVARGLHAPPRPPPATAMPPPHRCATPGRRIRYAIARAFDPPLRPARLPPGPRRYGAIPAHHTSQAAHPPAGGARQRRFPRLSHCAHGSRRDCTATHAPACARRSHAPPALRPTRPAQPHGGHGVLAPCGMQQE